MSAEAPSLPGYSDGRELGKGGYAVVYLYRDETRGDDVAVKILQLRDEGARGQFADEIRVLSSFGDDPLIVPYLGEGNLDDGRPYFVMRYCPGGSLSKWVAGQGLPVADVVDAGLRIGRALDALHRRHWLHRDIKPSNILVDEDGREPRLSDFGIATRSRSGEAEQADPAISVAWSAPEMITKASHGSVASDVYSLGATLWQLLTGHSPYEIPGGDNSPDALERRIVGTRLRGLGRDGVPTAFEHLLRSMLEKDPAARPRTAADVVAVLELIDAQLRAAPVIEPTTTMPIQASPDAASGDAATFDVPGTAPPQRSTKRRALIVSGVVVLIIGALVAAGSLSRHSASGAAQDASRSTAAAAGTGPGAQDAGVLGNEVPPGVPAVSATRINADTLRFGWSYAAPEATDTFAWRMVGGTRSGVLGTTTIELSDPAGERLCIQVRVVPVQGGAPDSAWSSPGCGS